MNYGVHVFATIVMNGKAHKVEYRNVTEIHYNFTEGEHVSKRVAFESDIHGTGITWDITAVQEFTFTLETVKADSF